MRPVAEVALTFDDNVVAVLSDGEVYAHRKEERVARQFGIIDKRHPTIKQIMDSGNWLLGGDLQVTVHLHFFTVYLFFGQVFFSL